ncbi:MAG: hypothetical protein JNL01_15830 [Bdellovibrionales bacterium]|nr:hypothetical protein [Bdellovibrionales bacterium]
MTEDKQLQSLFQYLRLGEIKRLVHRFNDELAKRDLNSISVISLEKSEGRTFLVAVLAVGTAFFLKKKVLVIDTSAQPEAGRFHLERIFSAATTENAAAKVVDLIVPLNSGPGTGDPVDFELKGLVEKNRDRYDLMIFDTSPVNSNSPDGMDPIIVSKTAGAAVMVLSPKTVGTADFRKIKNEMKDWEIPILGSVYNFGKNQ